jgi:Stage III sporulation protein AB (spore_III_AB).
MIFKITGAILIVASCSMGGALYSNIYINRLENLKAFSICLEMLRSEIAYTHMTLSEASSIIGQKTDGPVADIFTEFACILNLKKGYTAHLAWEEALNKNLEWLDFNDEEIELIKTLGDVIGTSDTVNQEKSLTLLSKQLDMLVEKAAAEKDKNVKMYRNLGLLGGLGLAILLI